MPATALSQPPSLVTSSASTTSSDVGMMTGEIKGGMSGESSGPGKILSIVGDGKLKILDLYYEGVVCSCFYILFCDFIILPVPVMISF